MTTDVATARVFARTCAAEWARLWNVRSTWWFLIAAAVVMLGMGTLVGFESAADPPELHGDPAWSRARFIAMPTQFALLGLAITAVTADYATGGIVPALQWTPRRGVLFAARALVTVGTATTIGVLLATCASLAAFTTAGGALTLGLADGVDMLGSVATVFAAGSVLSVGLGFALRRTAGALISAFLLILVLPLLLSAFGGWMATIARGLPGAGAMHLLFRGVPEMTITSSVVVLVVWAVGVLVLGWLRLMRDDANR